jgi:hypothetical protein
MNTYLISKFKDDYGKRFTCIFEIEPEPFSVSSSIMQTNRVGNLVGEKYKIIKVVMGNPRLITKFFIDDNNNKRYKWKFKFGGGFHGYATYRYIEYTDNSRPEVLIERHNIKLELPDDASAILYWKLESSE